MALLPAVPSTSMTGLVRERTPEGTDYTYSWDEYNRVTGVSACDARDVRNLGTPVTTFYEYADSVNPNPSAVIESNGAKTSWSGMSTVGLWRP